MCTAISYKTACHYFGRNLDLEHRYCESVTITPRYFPLEYRKASGSDSHYAMIGMASVIDGYPLYYEATNEHGLSMAGLNFPGNAVYLPAEDNRDNITPFEFIPWILQQCKTIEQAKCLLKRINIVDIPFSGSIPLSPLHWMIADKTGSIVVEPMNDGINIYDDPVGVLTNNPTFDFHLQNLSNYLNLTCEEPTNRFSGKVDLTPYSRGMGAFGLPGDLSSASRFVRATFTKLNAICGDSETESVNQFFHILGSVAQQKGCVKVGNAYEKTVYSCCCNTDKGIYYYTTYENRQITGVRLLEENINCNALTSFPLSSMQQIRFEN